MTSIAVRHHLGWGPLGIAPLARFAAAYRSARAGIAHDLVILRNADVPREQLPQIGAALTGIAHDMVDLDRAMLALEAYGQAATQLKQEHVCLLNAHSAPAADGWLNLLAGGAARLGVGVVGSTGSYESHADAARGAPRRRLVNLVALRRMRRDFAPFPNPHLRTTGMFMKTSLARSLGLETAVDKPHAYVIESGRQGITRQVEERGLDALVVGRDGRVFAADDWPASRTFRSGEQENLLVADNQTRQYQEASAQERRLLRRDTWGEGR